MDFWEILWDFFCGFLEIYFLGGDVFVGRGFVLVGECYELE